MNSYRMLAVRYLKMNKKRSLITILGVIITTVILFTVLNLGLCFLLNQREKERENGNYEIVLMTETEEQIHQILADRRIKSAYVGPYYWYSHGHEELYPMALYINTSNPYRMNTIYDQLRKDYGVEGELHFELAWTYMQGYEGNLIIILTLTVILVSFIFAIFGVGIVRNSIQLCTLENIRDYGNMRCIGASRGQLKQIIYMQGAILELTGILIGCLLGTGVSVIVGMIIKLPMGFHFLPMAAVLVVFLGDLYFAMGEDNKLITGMTPVSAIRGEYRIHKEKIKLREKNPFRKLFGVEGDYAYKSVMRNPGRFFRTVSAMVFGIGAFMAIAGIANSINALMKEQTDRFQYFQIYFELPLRIDETIEKVQSTLPPTSELAKLSELDCITEAKRIYSSEIWLADLEGFYEKNQIDTYTRVYEIYQEAVADSGKDETSEIRVRSLARVLAGIYCYGYDDMDFQRYQSALVEGTLDISENGIVIINEGQIEGEEMETLGPEIIDVTFTDYKVGDTIDIVNMQRFRSETSVQLAALEADYEREMQQIEEEYGSRRDIIDNQELWEELDEKQSACYSDYSRNRNKIVYDCWQQLLQEGDYKTYTVEGILNEDVNYYDYYGQYAEGSMIIVLPLEQYFAMTGTDETMNTGMQYHVQRYPNNKRLVNTCREITGTSYMDEGDLSLFGYVWSDADTQYIYSAYPDIMEALRTVKNRLWYAVLVVVFVVSMAALNIINSTASNLYLRRKEFAQLRVIGVSKKRLMKMVLLEGVIAVIVADLIGILLGTFLSAGVYRIVTTLIGASYQFPFLAAVLGVLASVLLLCGSIYVPLKGLGQNMAEDLTAGGD
ncbi:MAG: ABC transporter permease [Bacteroides sp.]|nr:ABC transporter permease [Bacteroides sp.]MCM1549174.1 ABC transporter permease [Clostridium sp.]